MSVSFLTLNDFRAAHEHIAPHVHRTPVLRSETLSTLTGNDVYLKAELFQKAGSYKVRGPLNVLAHMTQAQITGLLDPTAYTGLCADMAREGAARARAVAMELSK